jgi:hypothetical protein
MNPVTSPDSRGGVQVVGSAKANSENSAGLIEVSFAQLPPCAFLGSDSVDRASVPKPLTLLVGAL